MATQFRPEKLSHIFSCNWTTVEYCHHESMQQGIFSPVQNAVLFAFYYTHTHTHMQYVDESNENDTDNCIFKLTFTT